MKTTTLSILCCFILALASCGGNNSQSSESNKDTTSTVSTEKKEPMQEGEKLMAASDCGTCHNKTEKVIGPAYVEIAAKYPSNDDNITKLANKIIGGGSGVWGDIPMTPHTTTTVSDAKEMVKYILSLKK